MMAIEVVDDDMGKSSKIKYTKNFSSWQAADAIFTCSVIYLLVRYPLEKGLEKKISISSFFIKLSQIG